MGTAASSTNSFLAIAFRVWILSAIPQEVTISGVIASTLAHVPQPCTQNGFGGRGVWRLTLSGHHWEECMRQVPGIT